MSPYPAVRPTPCTVSCLPRIWDNRLHREPLSRGTGHQPRPAARARPTRFEADRLQIKVRRPAAIDPRVRIGPDSKGREELWAIGDSRETHAPDTLLLGVSDDRVTRAGGPVPRLDATVCEIGEGCRGIAGEEERESESDEGARLHQRESGVPSGRWLVRGSCPDQRGDEPADHEDGVIGIQDANVCYWMNWQDLANSSGETSGLDCELRSRD